MDGLKAIHNSPLVILTLMPEINPHEKQKHTSEVKTH